MNDIIFEVLKCVIIVAIMAVTGYLMPWLKNNTELAKNQILSDMILAAVQYAEQTVNGAGKEKKALVTDYLKTQLKAKGINITDEQLNALIESAVYALNEAKKGDAHD